MSLYSAVASCTAGLRFATAEKRSQLPDDCCLVSDDAPNGSWTDSVHKAAAAFLCFGCRGAHSRPSGAKSDRAVTGRHSVLAVSRLRNVGSPRDPTRPALAWRSAFADRPSGEAWKSAERRFRGESRHRVLVARSTTDASCRVTDGARNRLLLAATARELEAEVDFRRAVPAADHRHAVASPNRNS